MTVFSDVSEVTFDVLDIEKRRDAADVLALERKGQSRCWPRWCEPDGCTKSWPDLTWSGSGSAVTNDQIVTTLHAHPKLRGVHRARVVTDGGRRQTHARGVGGRRCLPTTSGEVRRPNDPHGPGGAYCPRRSNDATRPGGTAVGFIRKSLSVATLGTAVKYRSKSERKLKVTEADSKAAIAADQTRLSIERQRAQAEMIAARAIAAQVETQKPTIGERLARTQRLLNSCFISQQEYDRKRAEILSEI